MAKDKKFLNLLEKYESRYEQQGFLVGDVFKFNDDFKSHEKYKELPGNVKDVIDSMIDSGLHTRVSQVNADSDDVVVASDHGGGRLVGKIRIPCCLGAPVDFGVNLPPIADVQKRDDKVTVKPEEAEEIKFHDQEEDEEEVVAEETEVVAEEAEVATEEEVVAESSYTQKYL